VIDERNTPPKAIAHNLVRSAATSLNGSLPSDNVKKQHARVALQGLDNPQEFQHVNPPLASLLVRHERLRLAE